ncbi:MAG: PAS domain S-box protein, partial [Lysobacteraceae bacterium]
MNDAPNVRDAAHLRGSFPYGPRGLVFLGLSLSLLLPILFAVLLWFDLKRENDTSAERANIVAESIQRQFGERLEQIASDLREIAETAPSSGAAEVANQDHALHPSGEYDAALHDIVLLRPGHGSDAQGVDVQGHTADASWLPRADSAAELSGLSIGVPVHSIANRRWIMPVVWDGLGGWRVGAHIDADWFADALSGYQVGEGGMLNLVHRDRVLIARSIDNQLYAGTRVGPSQLFDGPQRNQIDGQFVETSVIDGTNRQFVFRRIPHTPVIVLVGVAQRHILALWWRFALISFSAALLLASLWFWLSREFQKSNARQAQLLAELREQSQRGEEARRIAKLGDWSWNMETGEVNWSPEVFAICGVPPRDGPMRIDEIPDFVHADDRERMRGYLSRAAAGGVLNETQYRILRPDGEVRWIHARAEWVDRTPGFRMLRGIQQDITELAETRDQLRRAQDEYRFLFEHNPLPMCVYDRHTLQILAANDAMAQHYGYTREELIAANMIDIRPPEEVASTRALLLRPSDEYPQGRIWTHSNKSGQQMRMMAFGHEIDFDAHPARLIVLHDVTESERTEQRFQLVARATSDAIWDWDPQADTTWRSDNAYALFGYTSNEIGTTRQVVETVVHPDDRIRITESLDVAIGSSATEWEETYRLQRKDGSYAEVLDRALILRDPHGRAIRMVGGMLDVTQRRRNEAELRLFRRAVESADNSILIADARVPGLPAVYVNHAFEKMTGYAASEIIGTDCRFLVASDGDEPGVVAIRQALSEQREARTLLHDRRKNGEMYWNDFHLAPVRGADGELTHFVSVQSDVSERQQILEQLAYRATYDELTGLPNRQLLFDRLQQGIRNADLQGRGIGVLFVDLDEFKLINDSMGHSAGDEVLRTIAQRFEKAVRSPDTLGRFGGD